MKDDNDGGQTATVEEAEVGLIAQVLDGLGKLVRLQLALAAQSPEIDLDDMAAPKLRVVIDESVNMFALGVQQRDGRVQQLAGYHLNAVRARLALLADATLREEDGGTPPASWH